LYFPHLVFFFLSLFQTFAFSAVKKRMLSCAAIDTRFEGNV
jgi:hypothetical protein